MAIRKISGQPLGSQTSRTPAKDRILEALRDGIRFTRVMDLVWPRRAQLIEEIAAGRKNWKPNEESTLEDSFFKPLELQERSQLRSAWIRALFDRIVIHARNHKQLRLSHLELFIDARVRRKLTPVDAWESMPWKARKLAPHDRLANCLSQIVQGVNPFDAWIEATELSGLKPVAIGFRDLLTAELAMGRNSTALNNCQSLDPLAQIRAAIQRSLPISKLLLLCQGLRQQLQASAKGKDWRNVGTLNQEFFNPLASKNRSDLRKAWNRALYRVLVWTTLREEKLQLDTQQRFLDARLRLRKAPNKAWVSLGCLMGDLRSMDRQCNYLMRIVRKQHPLDAWVASASVGSEVGLIDFRYLLVAEIARSRLSTALSTAMNFNVVEQLRAAIERKRNLVQLEKLGLSLRRQILKATHVKDLGQGPLEQDFISILRFDRDNKPLTNRIRVSHEWNEALLRRILRRCRHKHPLQLCGRDWFLDGRIRLEHDQYRSRSLIPKELGLHEYGNRDRKTPSFVDQLIGTRSKPGLNPQLLWQELFGSTRMNVEDVFIAWLARGESPATAAQWAVDETVAGSIKALRRIVG